MTDKPTQGLTVPTSKSVAASATYQGLALVLLPMVASAVGLDPDQLAKGVDAAVQLAGVGLAIYGRWRAGGLHLPWQQ